MSRQDANAAFALSSFLYGSNAPYIEEMYARFEENPASVDGEWQEFFREVPTGQAQAGFGVPSGDNLLKIRFIQQFGMDGIVYLITDD